MSSFEEDSEEVMHLAGKRRFPDEPSITSVDPPWLSGNTKKVANPLVRLHNEIIDYGHYIVPNAHERQLRESHIELITQYAKGLWPDAQVHIFGSYSTGLSLFSSDVDVVIIAKGSKNPQDFLKRFESELRQQEIASNLELILTAKVPILKIVFKKTGIHFDISFNVLDGVKSTKPIRMLMEEYPPLKWIALVVKAFLREKEFYETHKQGIGSFLAVIMVTAFLQYEKKREPEKFSKESLAELLIKFFKFYGSEFNHQELGLSIIGKGSFYQRKVSNHGLSAENPQDVSVELGRSITAFTYIAGIFRNSFNQLNYYNLRLNEVLNLTR